MRVLIIDDSTIFRKVIRDAVEGDPEIEVVGTAANGRLGLEKIEQLHPDIITLDMEMPEIDGLEVLRKLRDVELPPVAILLSAFTSQGATLTARALRLGAFDFVLKPSSDDFKKNALQLREALVPRLHAAYQTTRDKIDIAKPVASRAPIADDLPMKSSATKPIEIIAIGISTGGPAALAKLLPELPADLPVPITIVQHMPPMFTKSLADDLNASCALQVMEAEHGQTLRAGEVYIAPGGKQMKIVRVGGHTEVRITKDAPERNCKPSVDYLFRSLSFAYGAHTLGVIMTGMGDDGTLGSRLLKRTGARVLAQHEASCVVYGMPRRIVEERLADAEVPLDQMSEVILNALVAGGLPCQ